MIYLAFGSNLSSNYGSPQKTITIAYRELSKYGLQINKKSSFSDEEYDDLEFKDEKMDELITDINKYVKTIYNDNSMKVINKKPGKAEEVHTIPSDLSLMEIADLYYRS